MKKETIWGLLLLALLTCQSAKAYDFAQDVLLYRITSDTTVEVVGIEFHDQGDGSNDHLIDTRPAFLSALSWHIIRHWLSSAKITIPFHFTKAFAEK